jgi:hypothetical protein
MKGAHPLPLIRTGCYGTGRSAGYLLKNSGEMEFITETERGCCLFHREPFI